LDAEWLQNHKLFFIEAKTSSPIDLDKYTDDIVTKFIDSIWIYIAVIFDRKNTQSTVISPQMKKLEHLKSKISLLLIIKNAEKRHLPPIQEALNKKLKKEIRMFSLEQSVLVMNEVQAKSRNFVQ